MSRSPRISKNLQISGLARRISFLSLIVFVIILPGKETEAKTYKIGIDDVLHISVWGQPDLDKDVSVFDDGMILFPLIDQVPAKGLTVMDLTGNITTLLEKDYLVDPQVTINIVEYNSQKIYVIGSVFKPGLYPLKGDTTVLDAITRAGGISPRAGKKLLILKLSINDIRRGENVEKLLDKRKTIEVDIYSLLNKGDLSQNLPVEADDVIFIPQEKEVADSLVYVIGEIRRPGSYSFKNGLTALKLCITAGGFTDISAPNRAEIIRTGKDGDQQIINLDLEEVNKGEKRDIALLPGDRIVIPESYF